MRKALWILALAVAAPASLVRPLEAEVTKTVGLTQDATRPFAVETLAGAIKVVAGSGTQAEVTATLYAESPALLEAMRFELSTDEKGRPSLKVRYPESERRFRYPKGESNTETKYDGRRVKVTRDSGVVAYADLEVRLPKDVAEAWLHNAVGAMQASGVSGHLRFDTGSGDITVSDVAGDVVADTGSGTLLATDIETRLLRADTGSGDIRVTRAQAEEVEADTGSGSVDLELIGTGLQRVRAGTGSGDVRLRLPRDASFEVRADMGSGDLESRFTDAQAIVNRREVVGYRRGEGRIKIDVDTGSGDVTVEPVG